MVSRHFSFIAFQTSDNRKSLLDEMAVTLQTKSDEANATIAGLEKDLEDAGSKLKVFPKWSLNNTSLTLQSLAGERRRAVGCEG